MDSKGMIRGPRERFFVLSESPVLCFTGEMSWHLLITWPIYALHWWHRCYCGSGVPKSNLTGITMIRHIVFFSAKRPKDVETIYSTLTNFSNIPGVQNFEIGRNRKVDALVNDVDIILHAQFASEKAIQAYKCHPIYLAGIEVVRPIRELRIVADYDIPM